MSTFGFGSTLATGLVALAATLSTAAAEDLHIGFVTTLTTPAGYLGEDARDAFKLALGPESRLGKTKVVLDVVDDGLKTANGKQEVDRLLQSGTKLYTGVIFSNVLAAVLPGVLEQGGFYVSNNAGPSTFAGEKCNPNYFVASYQNDSFHEAAGLGANRVGYKKMVLLAPNYQAGRDALEGFKRAYKGEVLAEIYTKLDQTDFSVEIARVRSLAPDAIYQFHPGGLGINFAKQYAAAGMNKTVPMLVPSFSMDARMVTATGGAAEGVYASALWTPERDDPESKAFVAAFKAAYGRTPTIYAQQAWDTAKLLASALDAVDGDIGKADAFRAALRKADFKSIRGAFAFGNNQHPVQDYYLTHFQKNAAGEIVQTYVERVAEKMGDAYADKCTMK